MGKSVFFYDLSESECFMMSSKEEDEWRHFLLQSPCFTGLFSSFFLLFLSTWFRSFCNLNLCMEGAFLMGLFNPFSSPQLLLFFSPDCEHCKQAVVTACWCCLSNWRCSCRIQVSTWVGKALVWLCAPHLFGGWAALLSFQCHTIE